MKKHFTELYKHINKNKVGNLIVWIVTLSLAFSTLYFGTIPLIWKIYHVIMFIILLIATLGWILYRKGRMKDFFEKEKTILDTVNNYLDNSKISVKLYNWFFRYIDFVFLIYAGSTGWLVFYSLIVLLVLALNGFLVKPYVKQYMDKYKDIIFNKFQEESATV